MNGRAGKLKSSILLPHVIKIICGWCFISQRWVFAAHVHKEEGEWDKRPALPSSEQWHPGHGVSSGPSELPAGGWFPWTVNLWALKPRGDPENESTPKITKIWAQRCCPSMPLCVLFDLGKRQPLGGKTIISYVCKTLKHFFLPLLFWSLPS